jgi:hypothetical protein
VHDAISFVTAQRARASRESGDAGRLCWVLLNADAAAKLASAAWRLMVISCRQCWRKADVAIFTEAASVQK